MELYVVGEKMYVVFGCDFMFECGDGFCGMVEC